MAKILHDPKMFMATPFTQLRVVTTVDDQTPITNQPPVEWKNRWQGYIDNTLIEWGRNPSLVEDAGIDAPSRDTVKLAVQLATSMMKAGQSPPTRIVPDPNGGIVFESKVGDTLETLRISAEDGYEYCLFNRSRLIDCTVAEA